MIFSITETNKKWWTLGAMAIALGMTFIDQTAIVIALPKIQQVFSLSPVLGGWIINAYLLTFAVFLALGGYLGDMFHYRRVFLVGMIIFVLASIACALSPNIAWLITARAIQGLGAALIVPNATVMVINVFPPEKRGLAMGIYISSALLFLPFALILGGIFTEFFSWRLIFWINFPLSLICFLITGSISQAIPAKEQQKIDWLGSAAQILAVAILVITLMEFNNIPKEIIVYLLTISGLTFWLFWSFEKRSTNPQVDFHLFQNNLFLLAIILFFFMTITTQLFVFDAIFYQQVLGYSPAIAGLLFLPNIFCMIFAAPTAGKILDRYGYQLPILIGLGMVLVGLFLNSKLALLQNYWYLLPGIVLINIGTPFILTSINTAALTSIELPKRGTASGILNSIRQIAYSISLGLLTSIIVMDYRYFLKKYLVMEGKLYPDLTLNLFEKILNLDTASRTIFHLYPQQFPQLYQTAKSAYARAYSTGIFVCGVFVLGAFIFTLMRFRKKNN